MKGVPGGFAYECLEDTRLQSFGIRVMLKQVSQIPLSLSEQAQSQPPSCGHPQPIASVAESPA